MLVQLIGAHSDVVLKSLHVRSLIKAELHACRMADECREPIVALCDNGQSLAAIPSTASN